MQVACPFFFAAISKRRLPGGVGGVVPVRLSCVVYAMSCRCVDSPPKPGKVWKTWIDPRGRLGTGVHPAWWELLSGTLQGGGREDSNHVSERWPQAVSVSSRAGRWWFCLLKEVSILLMTPRGINVEKKKKCNTHQAGSTLDHKCGHDRPTLGTGRSSTYNYARPLCVSFLA